MANNTSAKRQQTRDMVDFYYRMGMAYLEDGDFQNGLVEFRAAEKLDPNRTEVLFAMGHTHFTQGNYGQAKLMMMRIVEAEPDNGEALNYLGNILEKQGDGDAAIAAFKGAAEIPSYRTPHFSLHNLGRIHLRRGELAQAEQAFRSAIRRVPDYYPARADLAKMYLDDGRWAEAADEWRVYMDIMPEGIEAHYYLGRAYIGLGQKVRAKAALQRFIDKAGPEHPLTPEAESLLDDLSQD